MRISTTIILLACLLLSARMPGVADPSARPIPAGQAACTAQTQQRLLAAYHRRVIVDAYKQVGTRNPAWDDAATRCLGDYVKVIDHLPDAPDYPALAAQGKALVDAGCDDPQVLYVYGTALHQLGRFTEAEAALRRATSGFEAGKYPRSRARLAPRRLLEVCAATGGGKAEERARWHELAARWTAEALADGSFQPNESRLALSELDKGWAPFYAEQFAAVAEALAAQPKADPYVVSVLTGRDEVRQAREAGVTAPDAHKTYATHMATARALFTEAWKAHPTYPEAPTEMIALAQACPAKDESPRRWFDRAAAAQMDYAPAYAAYRNTLRAAPDALYAFGLECLRTRRFDTDVPLEFLTALRAIDDVDGSRAYWRKPGTFPAMKVLCDGYAKTGHGGDAAWYRTLYAAAAWYSHRYADARQALDALGDAVQPAVFTRVFGARYELVAPEIYALSGSFAEKVALAQSLESRKRDEAIKIYTALLGKITDAREKRFMQQRLNELHLQAQLASGAWIDITPDAKLTGWTIRGGTWTVTKDGLLKGTSGRDGLMLVCDRDFGDRVEVRGEIIFLRSPFTNFNAAVLVGVPDDDGDFISVAAYARENRACLRRRFEDAGMVSVTAAVKDHTTFLVQANGNTVTVTLNGQQVARDAAVPGADGLGARIGVGGNYWYPGVEIGFSRLQARRVPSAPAKGAANGASAGVASEYHATR